MSIVQIHLGNFQSWPVLNYFLIHSQASVEICRKGDQNNRVFKNQWTHPLSIATSLMRHEDIFYC